MAEVPVVIRMTPNEAMATLQALRPGSNGKDHWMARYHIAEGLWQAGYELRLSEQWQPRLAAESGDGEIPPPPTEE